jgi:hypothetical protein
MKVNGKHKFDEPIAKIWDSINQPVNLEKSIPGCQKLVETEPDTYEAILQVGISAVKGTYKGNVRVREKVYPNSYKLSMSGEGAPGYVKGEVKIELQAEGEGRTLLSYDGDLEVGGLIATIGQRMIGGVAKLIIGQFFKNMEKRLQELT